MEWSNAPIIDTSRTHTSPICWKWQYWNLYIVFLSCSLWLHSHYLDLCNVSASILWHTCIQLIHIFMLNKISFKPFRHLWHIIIVSWERKLKVTLKIWWRCHKTATVIGFLFSYFQTQEGPIVFFLSVLLSLVSPL